MWYITLMSHTSTLIVLGVLTMLLPFSGLPVELRTWLAVIFGALVTAIALFIRGREAAASRESMATTAPASAPAPSEVSATPSAISSI